MISMEQKKGSTMQESMFKVLSNLHVAGYKGFCKNPERWRQTLSLLFDLQIPKETKWEEADVCESSSLYRMHHNSSME